MPSSSPSSPRCWPTSAPSWARRKNSRPRRSSTWASCCRRASRPAGRDRDAPVHADTEQTLAEIRARLDSVIAYLKGFAPDAFAGAAERRITQPRWNGKSLSGQEFLVQHVIPNFYFHVTTAYAILRHNGVGIGKRNYLGDMPYREAAAA